MKKLLSTFLLICFLNCGLAAQSKVTNEDYKIYAVVLEEIGKEYFKANQEYSFVILDRTVKPDSFAFDVGKKIKGLNRDFKRKNKITADLENRFPLKIKNYVISKNEVNRLLKVGSENAEKISSENEKNNKLLVPHSGTDLIWKPFHEKFPESDGYYSFSRIGFNSTRKFAVVQVNEEGGSWNSYIAYILIKTKKVGEFMIYRVMAVFPKQPAPPRNPTTKPIENYIRRANRSHLSVHR